MTRIPATLDAAGAGIVAVGVLPDSIAPRDPITYDLTNRDIPRRLEQCGLPTGETDPWDNGPLAATVSPDSSFEELVASLNFEPFRRKANSSPPKNHPISVPDLRSRFPHYDLAVQHYAERLGTTDDAKYFVAAKLS
eukprot:SAG31_NODE_6057_length_2189_cov_5.721531_2_plen_136_part_01